MNLSRSWTNGNTEDIVALFGSETKAFACIDGNLKVAFVSQLDEIPMGVLPEERKKFIKILLTEVAFGITKPESCVNIINKKRQDMNLPPVVKEFSEKILDVLENVEYHGSFYEHYVDVIFCYEGGFEYIHKIA